MWTDQIRSPRTTNFCASGSLMTRHLNFEIAILGTHLLVELSNELLGLHIDRLITFLDVGVMIAILALAIEIRKVHCGCESACSLFGSGRSWRQARHPGRGGHGRPEHVLVLLVCRGWGCGSLHLRVLRWPVAVEVQRPHRPHDLVQHALGRRVAIDRPTGLFLRAAGSPEPCRPEDVHAAGLFLPCRGMRVGEGWVHAVLGGHFAVAVVGVAEMRNIWEEKWGRLAFLPAYGSSFGSLLAKEKGESQERMEPVKMPAIYMQLLPFELLLKINLANPSTTL